MLIRVAAIFFASTKALISGIKTGGNSDETIKQQVSGHNGSSVTCRTQIDI